MNTQTIGTQLAELENKIKDECGLGFTAKNELLKAVDALAQDISDRFDMVKQETMQSIASIRSAIPAHFDGRNEVLSSLIAPAEQPEQQDKAA